MVEAHQRVAMTRWWCQAGGMGNGRWEVGGVGGGSPPTSREDSLAVGGGVKWLVVV